MTTATAEAFGTRRSVLGRAFDILECFGGGHADQTIASLCDLTGLPPATVHRMLANLVEWGAIERAGRGRYRLGRRLWLLGSDVPASRDLKETARPCLVDLHTMTGEIAVLASVDGDGEQLVVADVIAGRRALGAWPPPRHLPLVGTAPGLVTLANLPVDECRAILDRSASAGGEPVGDFALRQQLGEVRRVGGAVARYAGRTWISSPIFDPAGAVRSTISVVVDADQANLPGLTRVVGAAARAVTQGLQARTTSVG